MKIIFYEGLFSYYVGFLKRSVIKKLKEEFPNAKIEQRHWKSRKKVFKNDADIVVGHSFGAWAAWENCVDVPLLITFDVRDGVRSSYVKFNSGVHLNFYQKAFLSLPGYAVDGAENHKISARHTSIVKKERCWWIIKSKLGNL